MYRPTVALKCSSALGLDSVVKFHWNGNVGGADRQHARGLSDRPSRASGAVPITQNRPGGVDDLLPLRGTALREEPRGCANPLSGTA